MDATGDDVNECVDAQPAMKSAEADMLVTPFPETR
jgi:hypothetical protein